jgi:oxygen-dependent protoporphyrinogen oxidase
MNSVLGKLIPDEKHVHIWGAGFSGLTLAYYLKDHGFKVTIYEKSHRTGGKIQTLKTRKGLVEKAANALFLNQDGLDLLKQLKLEPIEATKKIRRLIYLNNWPRTPFQLRVILKVLFYGFRKPPLITDGLNVADFFKPLLGQENINQILSPIFGGIYATPCDELHFKSVFPQVQSSARFESYWAFIKFLINDLKARPKAEMSGSVSFDGGMQVLIDRLSEVLKHDLKLNTKEKFKLRPNTIICTDAHSAADLIKDLLPELSQELSRINYRPLTSSTVFLKREIKCLNRSFGVVIPFKSSMHSIGILNNRSIFPVNNQNVTPYTFISPKEIERQEIFEDINKLAPDLIMDDIEHSEITFWPAAIPIYNLQRYLAVKKINHLLVKHQGLVIFGNYTGSISLREMISSAKDFAQKINN